MATATTSGLSSFMYSHTGKWFLELYGTLGIDLLPDCYLCGNSFFSVYKLFTCSTLLYSFSIKNLNQYMY
jgi:hypothetical protein